ncbi:hypothetical protein ACFE04_015331 [Oxalis oulophora]
MTQLNRSHHTQNPTSPTSPAIEQVLCAGEASRWSPNISPTCHDMEDGNHQKKSVLAKVKEKAKKWKHSLSMKKRHNDDSISTTPSWRASVDDEHYNYEDSAPFVTPKVGPETNKEPPRQIARASDPFISEKHVDHGSEMEKEKDKGKAKLIASPDESVTKETPAIMSPAKETETEEIVKKIQNLTVSTQTEPATVCHEKQNSTSLPVDKNVTLETEKDIPITRPVADKQPIVETEQKSSLEIEKPAASFITDNEAVSPVKQASPGQQVWEKGIAMKEYIMNKLEPGEDERALSQVIVDAISPRRNPGDASVVDKVKDVVTSLIWSEEQENPKANLARANNTTRSVEHVPVSNTAACEVVEEENHGRILQAN